MAALAAPPLFRFEYTRPFYHQPVACSSSNLSCIFRARATWRIGFPWVTCGATVWPPGTSRDRRHAAMAKCRTVSSFGPLTSPFSPPASPDPTRNWTQLNTTAADGKGPGARHAHAAVAYEGCMYVFGGYPGAWGAMADNDLWKLDITTLEWSRVSPPDPQPQQRGVRMGVVSRRYGELLSLVATIAAPRLRPRGSSLDYSRRFFEQ